MRVMVIVKGDNAPGELPPPEIFEMMGDYNERLAKAGVMVDGGGLLPSTDGRRVAFEDGETRVIDGPFAESKELVAGFWLLSVDSLEEALEWVRQAPFGGGIQLEVRPVADDDAFDHLFNDAMREQQARTSKLVAENARALHATA